MPKGFSEETKREVYEAQNGYDYFSLEPIDDFHHIVPNTKTNRKLYPLFINSPFNCLGVSRLSHIEKKSLFVISHKRTQMYEEYLRGLKNDQR